MSWCVVDTNQAIRMRTLPKSHQGATIEGITIPTFVLAELLRSTNHEPIKNLTQYPLRLGMTPGEVMHRIASLRRSQIVAFSPFHNRTPQEIQQGLLNLPSQEVQKFVAEATTHIKAGGDVFRSARKGIRDYLKSQGHDPRNFKLDGFSDALQKLATGANNFIEQKLMQFASENDTRKGRACSRSLYAGAMANPYLRRFFHTLLWYILSYQQVWTQLYDDWNISIKGNDWTDITLSLYAAPGDIILSNDRTVRKAVLAVNPDGAVRTALATI